jgi:hypothetical protein
MKGLAPGTLVKTLRTNMDTLEQSESYGVVRWRAASEQEAYFVSWRDGEGGVVYRDEFELLTREERLNIIAAYVMNT